MAAVFLSGKQLQDRGVLQQINLVLASAGLQAVNLGGLLRIQDMSADPSLRTIISSTRRTLDPSLRANFTDLQRMALRRARGAKVGPNS